MSEGDGEEKNAYQQFEELIDDAAVAHAQLGSFIAKVEELHGQIVAREFLTLWQKRIETALLLAQVYGEELERSTTVH